MKHDRFITKKFTTIDNNGLQFIVTVYYGSIIKHIFTKGGKVKIVRDIDYYAMGYHAKTLQDIKTMVSNMESK